jgi:hypothetical protein
MNTNTIAIVLLFVAAAESVIFIGVYTRYTDWWRSEVGWYLVMFPGVLGLLAINALVFRVLGEYTSRQYINIGLFCIWVIAVGWLLTILYRANSKEKREKG